MQAAVLTDFGQPLRLEELPIPEPAADEVLLQVDACGVCHSDLHIVDGDLPRFRNMAKSRVVPGHEVVGRIVALGSAVGHLAVGDRVGVAWRHGACGVCEQCTEGYENMCQQVGVTGLTVDGGYAQYMKARASHALPVPVALRSDEAAPLFCAGVSSYRALKHAGVRQGQRVAVFGVGGLGHLAVQIAVAMGAEVAAVDIGSEKLAFALEMGATVALDATDPETASALKHRGGMHVAVVTSAARSAYDAALQCLRPTGTLCVLGLPSEPLQIPATAVAGSEIRIVGSSVGTRADILAVLELAARGLVRCRVEAMPLSRVNEVFAAMRHGAIRGRVVLVPNG